jgi:hypothetical protein
MNTPVAPIQQVISTNKKVDPPKTEELYNCYIGWTGMRCEKADSKSPLQQLLEHQATHRNNIFKSFLTANNVPPPPHKDYRYYHCELDWDGLSCKKVDGPQSVPSDNHKLLFVKSYIPEQLDKYMLKYKWMPDRVVIEENQLKS